MVSLRLQEGPIIVVSFANPNSTVGRNARGQDNALPAVIDTKSGRQIFGLYVALSNDEASTWESIRVVSDGRPAHNVETTDGHLFSMDETHGETQGYLSAIQDPRTGIVHFISSRQHYQFDLSWIQET